MLIKWRCQHLELILCGTHTWQCQRGTWMTALILPRGFLTIMMTSVLWLSLITLLILLSFFVFQCILLFLLPLSPSSSLSPLFLLAFSSLSPLFLISPLLSYYCFIWLCFRYTEVLWKKHYNEDYGKKKVATLPADHGLILAVS